MNWVIILLALAALGAGSLLAGGALIVNAIAAHVCRSRCANPAEAFLSSGPEAAVDFTEDDLYGLRGISWTLWGIVSALVGLVLAYLLLPEHNAVLALVGLSGAFVPRLVRAYLVRRRKARIDRHVRAFISLLLRARSLGSGLRPALQDIAWLLQPGIVRERLHHHLDSPFISDPTDVIKSLARDIRSAALDSLVAGIQTARKAGDGFGEIVIRYPWATIGCYDGTRLVVDLLMAEPGFPARDPCPALHDLDRHHPLACRPARPLIRAAAWPPAERRASNSLNPWIVFPVTGDTP